MRLVQHFSYINKGKGYSLEELKEFATDSKNSEQGMDEIFGDLAVAGKVIAELIDKLEIADQALSDVRVALQANVSFNSEQLLECCANGFAIAEKAQKEIE